MCVCAHVSAATAAIEHVWHTHARTATRRIIEIYANRMCYYNMYIRTRCLFFCVVGQLISGQYIAV